MKLLLLFKTKAEAKPCVCGDAITAGLKLHLVTRIYYYTALGLTEMVVLLSSMYRCQKMLICQAACSQSLASENISTCRQNQSWFLQSSRQYQRSTASVQYQDEHGHALCICPIQKYYLPTSLLSSQLSCWKR